MRLPCLCLIVTLLCLLIFAIIIIDSIGICIIVVGWGVVFVKDLGGLDG